MLAMGFAKLGAGTVQAAPASPAAAGLGNLAVSYAGALGSVLVSGAGIFFANKFVEDPNTKQAIIGGLLVSGVAGVIGSLFGDRMPGVKAMLSGDDTAAKLSAMYGVRGLGQGTSIMPNYTPIGEYFAAQGEYFTGQGEYYTNPVGEYFESGVQGLGNYTGNPELLEAAAGYGAAHTGNTNHVDPSSNLDREMDIMEAAAGVGTAYEAAAGGYGALPPYEAQAGFGTTVSTVPSASTWIPGTTDGAIWAGVRPVNRSQSATAETPAGILATAGGAGILG